MPTDDPLTEVAQLPQELDLRAPVQEPWRVIDGLADWRAMPPTSPTPPTTHLPFLPEVARAAKSVPGVMAEALGEGTSTSFESQAKSAAVGAGEVTSKESERRAASSAVSTSIESERHESTSNESERRATRSAEVGAGESTSNEPQRRAAVDDEVEPADREPDQAELRRDTIESPLPIPEATPTAPRPPPARPSGSADEQRRIATVLQLELPRLELHATPTSEIARPRVLDPAREERLLVRIVVGALVLVCLVFVVTSLWPANDRSAVRSPPELPKRVPPPPPPPAVESPATTPLDEWSLDPHLHRVDTLAVHAADLPTHPRHRYLVSVDQLPRGAVVAARLDDVNAGWGALFGVAPGRVLAVHGVRSVRLHCEPPESFTASTTLEVRVLDTTTKETRLISLRPARDCLDLGAGRVVRLTEPLRLVLPAEPRRTLKVAYGWHGREGTMAAGTLSPGQTARLEPGVVQIAVVSHSVSDDAPVKFELGPADVEAPREQVQYLTPSLTPVRPPPAPKLAPKPPELDIWPRTEAH